MVIDIDAFLDGVDKEQLETDVKKSKPVKVTLDFQKDVEDKIVSFQKNIAGKDFKFLKNIYDEIKRFDEDLPNKFAGIETKGRFALQELGDKYTGEFTEINRNNAKILSGRIGEEILKLDEFLSAEKFSDALDTFRKILEHYSYFPNSFLKERILISANIKKKEIEICELLEKYHERKRVEIKREIAFVTAKLKTDLQKGNLKDIEASVAHLQMLVDNIPKVLVSMFTKEKVFATRILIHAEGILVNKYEEEFNRRTSNLDLLFEKFHEHYMNKNLDGVLIVYNEVLLQFKELPDYFIDRKTSYYKQINKLFGMVDKLVISHNVSEFMESYEYSKRFDSVKEYLVHIERTGNVNFENLQGILDKVSKYPAKYEMEKGEIMRKINEIFLANKDRMASAGTGGAFDLNDVSSSVHEESVKPSVKHEDHAYSGNVKPKNDYTKSVLEEIDVHYQRFKKSTSPEEIKMLYKKVVFYLNHSPVKPAIKVEVMKKLNAALKEKKLV